MPGEPPNQFQTHVKLTWFTYKSSRRPVWLESDPLPMVNQQRWRGFIYKVRKDGANLVRDVVGEAAFALTGDARKIAMRWQRNDLNGSLVTECLFDIFRGHNDHINGSGMEGPLESEGASNMLSGVWQEVNNPEHRAIHFQKGNTRDANDNLQDAELVFPLLFDNQGEPVWLYGQYGPGGFMPNEYTYGVDPVYPGDPPNLVYMYLKYNPGNNCAGSIHNCAHALRPAAGLFKLTRTFTQNTHPNGPAPARIEIGNTDNGSTVIDLPGGGSHTLRSWRRPGGGGTVQIRKLNTYASIQADRYQCQTPGPPPATCPVKISWASGISPNASVWRYLVANGTQTRISNAQAWGTLNENLAAGARVRYRLYAGTTDTGQILSETPEITAYGPLPDDPVEPLGVPNHDPTAGAMPGTPGVSGGAATYEIPIQLPPGRNGMQPAVALTYSSRAGNGIAGIGWSLSGLSSIHRCPKTVDQDDVSTAVDYSLNDRLCLDGRRLMLTSETPQGVAYGEQGAVYRTEIDDFARVTQEGGSIAPGTGAHFKVEHKSGLVDWYGYAAGNAPFGSDGGRHTASGAIGPLSWALVRREDRDGNFIRYRYQDFGNGEHLLAAVTYTGQGATQGSRRVEFTYANRLAHLSDDYGSSYLAGGLTLQTRRLTHITTYAPTSQAPGAPAVKTREYVLNYGNHSSYTGRSLLRGVQECAYSGGVATCKDATQFGWQDSSPGFVFKEINFAGLPLPYPVILDPLDDEELPPSDPPESLIAPQAVDLLTQLWLERLPPGGRGVAPGGKEPEEPPQNENVQSLVRDFRPFGDFDGDGTLEWYARIRTGQDQHAIRLIRMNADRQIVGVIEPVGMSAFYSGSHPSMQPADINNDGRAELVGHDVGKIAFGFWNLATAQFEKYISSVPYNLETDSNVNLRDFDGDGRVDILLSTASSVVTTPAHNCPALNRVLVLYRNVSPDVASQSPQFAVTPQFVDCLAHVPGSIFKPYETIEHVSDFDGNGLPDLYIVRATNWLLISGDELKRIVMTHQAGTGAVSFEKRLPTQLGMTANDPDLRRTSANIVRWADVNGDGLDDLVVGETTWKIRLNRGGTAGLGPRIETGASQGLYIDAVGEQPPKSRSNGTLTRPA